MEEELNMPADWSELIGLTGSRPIVVERVRVLGSEARIEGEFALPALATLSAEDQVFVTAFVRSHGSIKRMEQLFGVSYPTIKNRLNRIGSSLDFVDISPEPETESEPERPSRTAILSRLEAGELDVEGAIELLQDVVRPGRAER
jgi:hypothetical protein